MTPMSIRPSEGLWAILQAHALTKSYIQTGTFSNTSGKTAVSTCVSCAADTYSGTASASCTACAENSTSITSSINVNSCICRAGYTGSGDMSCKGCLQGTYKELAGNGACTPCDVNRFSELFSRSNVSTCQKCPGNSSTRGLTGSSSYTSCVCDEGYWLGGERQCLQCGMGTYKSSQGNENCTQCPANMYLKEFGATGATRCRNCTANSVSPAGSAVNTSCECIPGYTGNGQDGCVACVQGKYKSVQGTDACTSCNAGTASNTLAATAIGTCVNCGAGKYSLIAQDICTDCAEGKYSTTPVATAESTCQNCGAGNYSLSTGGANIASCLQCAAGKFSLISVATAESTCTPCTKGKYSSVVAASTDTCTWCSMGTMQPVIGANSSASCLQCPVGKSSNRGV